MNALSHSKPQPRMTPDKKDRLIAAAADLFHRHGVNFTSLAAIAETTGIPIGNVYFYFKTKEELALAVALRRKEQFAAACALLDDSFPDPRQRLCEALGYFENVRADYASYGCPVGKLVMDGGLEKTAVMEASAGILADFAAWAEKQFLQLGHADEARRHAVSLVAGIQGAAIVAKALGDPQVIFDEMARLTGWIESLPNRKISIGKAGRKSNAA